jgi:hypothetical protein
MPAPHDNRELLKVGDKRVPPGHRPDRSAPQTELHLQRIVWTEQNFVSVKIT